MFFWRMCFAAIFALCGAVVVAGGAMADTVNLKAAEEEQGVPQSFVKWCAENGATYPLHCAAGYGDIAKMKRLIAGGVEVDKVYASEKVGGGSPLFIAIEANQVAAISVLMEAGANVNLRAPYEGWELSTPLHIAAQSGNVGAIETLVKAGADVNALADDNEVPLHVAASRGHVGAIKALVNAGTDVNAVERNDWDTPLHLAAKSGNADAVETLLNAGAYHSPVSLHGSTPMHVAALFGDVAVTEVLIKAGADIYAVDNSGMTPLIIARLVHRWGVVRLLEKNTRVNPPRQQDKSAPGDSTVAEHVFEGAWRSVVYIRTNDGQGSGVIIRPNIVATNCHVVEGGGISVHKAENRRTTKTRYRAVIRHADNKNDFCLLDVKGLWGVPANVRRYDTLRVGESVYGLGAPQGLDLSMSTGIISQKRAAKGVRYIQTDVAISPGSSGGGLFDREGNLVGIMTAKIVGEDVEGIGFAIPADLALE